MLFPLLANSVREILKRVVKACGVGAKSGFDEAVDEIVHLRFGEPEMESHAELQRHLRSAVPHAGQR